MSKQHKIFLIAGLSGIGKSSLIKAAASSSEGLVQLSAGQLISEKRSKIPYDKLRQLSDNEILQNQYLLVSSFKEKLKSIPLGYFILIDVHFVVETGKGTIKIPFDIIQGLRPTTIIHLAENPITILNRRSKDLLRDRPSIPEIDIFNHQKDSILLARSYADRLNTPFHLLEGFTYTDFMKIIFSYQSSGRSIRKNDHRT